MKNFRWAVVAIAVVSVCAVAGAQKDSAASTGGMMHATGTFEIQMKPQGGGADGKRFPRLTSDKQSHGDLEGTSVGEMGTAGSV